MLAMAASALSVGSLGLKTSAFGSYAIGSKGNRAPVPNSIPSSRIRLSLVGLRANGRQFVPPGPLLRTRLGQADPVMIAVFPLKAISISTMLQCRSQRRHRRKAGNNRLAEHVLIDDVLADRLAVERAQDNCARS